MEAPARKRAHTEKPPPLGVRVYTFNLELPFCGVGAVPSSRRVAYRVEKCAKCKIASATQVSLSCHRPVD